MNARNEQSMCTGTIHVSTLTLALCFQILLLSIDCCAIPLPPFPLLEQRRQSIDIEFPLRIEISSSIQEQLYIISEASYAAAYKTLQ